MSTFFVFSSLLCIILVSIRICEIYMNSRVLGKVREKVNVSFKKSIERARETFFVFFEYTHKELFTKLLHMVIYGTLFFVRRFERGLESLMVWLRSLRRTSRAKRIAREKERKEKTMPK